MKPSFGQVLSYIQEGEPLTLDLPKRNASIYKSSHFYLDNFPNASEPLSDAPMPHTTLNPAAAFETADEGYEGVPFPRPPREFTRPSFLPDSDDGGTDPGQALRNDGLNPPRPPTLGGRMRESGIQAAEAIVAGGAAGAAAAVRSVSENQTMLVLRGGGDWLDRTLRIPRHWPPHRRKSSVGPRKWSPCCRGRGSGRRRWSARRRRTLRASLPSNSRRSEGFATATEAAAAAGAAEAAAAAEGGGMLAALGEGALAAAGTVGAATGGLAVAGAGAALVGTAWAIEGGLNAASHLMGWGAATGGGTDSDASRPSMTTDVQTLNGMQESGAVDHYFIQEQRRAQRPEVFRIDTESESEPRNRPLPQIRSRPARRPRPQAQTPFGLNNVPIPVSSDSDRSRISRQSRGDRGPLGTQPSFEALRQASEPVAA